VFDVVSVLEIQLLILIALKIVQGFV
jgi:hypothetical protein